MKKSKIYRVLLYMFLIVNGLSIVSSLVLKMFGKNITLGDMLDFLLVFNGTAFPFYFVLLIMASNIVKRETEDDGNNHESNHDDSF